jgi:hypothetical protein
VSDQGAFDHLSPPVKLVKEPFAVKSPFAGADRAVVHLPARAPAVATLPGRRPVVAMIDSGIGGHPWLDPTAGHVTWIDATSQGWDGPGPAASLASPDVGDVRPADGTIDVFAGHGTFVAGLVHQVAPEAQLLSMQVMDASGFFPGGAVESALAWLLDRVRGSGEFVDILCLAFGYYEDSPMQDEHTTALRSLLGELGDLGVQVVVAAGNDVTEAPTYPAAFARLAEQGSRPRTPLVSVGATNPDGTPAEYSNRGSWVEVWEQGTAVVSTVPVGFGVRAESSSEGAAFDPDNLVGGFARWAGTSFAAALYAGRLAAQLAEVDLSDVSPSAAAARVAAARGALARS